MKILKGREATPRRTLLYGIHGWGKSSVAACWPSPIFLDVEDGLADLDVAKTEPIKSFADAIAAVMWLGENEHQFSTVVIDTMDWLEKLVHTSVAQDQKKANIEEIGYGKGYKFAVAKWEYLLNCLKYLTVHRNMHVLLLAHANIDAFDSPETERYDRYEPDLRESDMIQEWCTEVFFANFKVFTKSEDLGFNKSRQLAVGGKDRFVRTQETAAALAKNRLGLPPEIPVEKPASLYQALAEYMPPIGQSPKPIARQVASVADVLSGPLVDFPPPEENIAGLVVDGSSKVAAA